MLASRKSRAALAALAGLVGYDLAQRRRAVLRNFPLVGHLRYLLEAFGPELRQYIVTSNNEERPFSRDQRRWIEASAEGRPNVFGFGTDDEVEAVETLTIVKQSPFPAPEPAAGEPGSAPAYEVPAAKVLGGAHGRRHAFRPASVVNVSGMSYGSLSPVAIEALNRGAALAGCLQNTGEGGLSDVPPPRRRARLPDRHRLLRLPRRGRPLLARAAAGAGGGSAGAGDRDQALPGGEAGPRRPAAGGQGDAGDRRLPRRPGRRRLRQPARPLGLRRRRRADRVRRDGRRTRPGCRSGSSRRSATTRSGATSPTG